MLNSARIRSNTGARSLRKGYVHLIVFITIYVENNYYVTHISNHFNSLVHGVNTCFLYISLMLIIFLSIRDNK
jgi:hypothetical protein